MRFNPPRRRLIVGISGASGVVLGVRLLELLRELDVESHLIMSKSAQVTLAYETDLKLAEVTGLADHCYRIDDMAACISSGSYRTLGMVIAPCSMKTLAAVAHGFSDSLLARAADVTLKERRRLVLMVRETPFNLAHLRNMTAVTEMGGVIFPPLPAFYQRPQSIAEMVDETVERVIELMGIAGATPRRWQGL
jgi:4-hydroxy-3-polyprenylbenzoate decarboxylase